MQAKQFSQWSILPEQYEFSINADTEIISLKEKIPEQAKKVQIYIYSETGYNGEQNHRVKWAFSTFYDVKYCQTHVYCQQAVTILNENVTLRLDDRKVIAVKRNAAFPSNHFLLTVSLIAYKI